MNEDMLCLHIFFYQNHTQGVDPTVLCVYHTIPVIYFSNTLCLNSHHQQLLIIQYLFKSILKYLLGPVMMTQQLIIVHLHPQGQWSCKIFNIQSKVLVHWSIYPNKPTKTFCLCINSSWNWTKSVNFDLMRLQRNSMPTGLPSMSEIHYPYFINSGVEWGLESSSKTPSLQPTPSGPSMATVALVQLLPHHSTTSGFDPGLDGSWYQLMRKIRG